VEKEGENVESSHTYICVTMGFKNTSTGLFLFCVGGEQEKHILGNLVLVNNTKRNCFS